MKPDFFDLKLNAALPFQISMLSCGPFHVPRVPDIHQAIHLAMVLEGDISGLLGTRQFNFSAGDCYLTGLWETHGSRSSRNGYRLLLITVNPEEVGRFLFTTKDKFIALLALPAPQRQELLKASGIARKLVAVLSTLQPKNDASLFARMEKRWLCIGDIFLALVENLTIPPELKASGECLIRLVPAIQLIVRNTRKISAPEAAAACNLSLSRFQHLWGGYFGIGFAAYERQHRFALAVEDLLLSHRTIKEIAAARGFCDENHFVKLFKAAYQTTPGRYRKLSKSDDSQA
ncbi:MAG: helix-turn-helix transcriptional regulator [Lentisphaerae bacterium]|nr:helix-turn-helix transcriptional regulator [Lentisphaerota bacterium]